MQRPGWEGWSHGADDACRPSLPPAQPHRTHWGGQTRQSSRDRRPVGMQKPFDASSVSGRHGGKPHWHPRRPSHIWWWSSGRRSSGTLLASQRSRRRSRPLLPLLLVPPLQPTSVAKCRLPARPRPMAGGNARRTPLAVPRRFWLPLTRLRHRNLHYPARAGGTRCRSRTGSSYSRHVGSRWDGHFVPVQFVPPPQPTLIAKRLAPARPRTAACRFVSGTMLTAPRGRAISCAAAAAAEVTVSKAASASPTAASCARICSSLHLSPQALQSVPIPVGPGRWQKELRVAQCWHCHGSPASRSAPTWTVAAAADTSSSCCCTAAAATATSVSRADSAASAAAFFSRFS